MYPNINVFGLEIPSYWLFMMTGLTSAILIVLYLNKKNPDYHLPKEDIFLFSLFAIIGGLVGAKLLFIIVEIPNMIKDPSLIPLFIFQGGLVFYGGVIGGIIMAFYYIRQYGLNPKKYVSLGIVAIPLGHAFGRIGCFFAGCCYGKPTGTDWGVIFPVGPAHLEVTERLHPVQLYEAGFEFIIFGVLLYLFFKKSKSQSYLLAAIYLITYGAWRFFIEFYRGDIERGVYLLSTSQWISLLTIFFGVLLLTPKVNNLKILNENPPTNQEYVRYLAQKNNNLK